MKDHRRRKLEAIDFIWNQATEQHSQRKWNATFKTKPHFERKKGHAFVRRDDGMELWRWTKKMIWKVKRSTLSLEREERLESIGFWDPPPAGYQEGDENNANSEREDENFSSSEADDDREPAAQRRRTTSTSKEEDEECSSRMANDSDGKPTAKLRQATSTDEAPITKSLFARYSAGTKVKKFF
jgi:hypothetical protein